MSQKTPGPLWDFPFFSSIASHVVLVSLVCSVGLVLLIRGLEGFGASAFRSLSLV